MSTCRLGVATETYGAESRMTKELPYSRYPKDSSGSCSMYRKPLYVFTFLELLFQRRNTKHDMVIKSMLRGLGVRLYYLGLCRYCSTTTVVEHTTSGRYPMMCGG